jgi:hypothetical protein
MAQDSDASRFDAAAVESSSTPDRKSSGTGVPGIWALAGIAALSCFVSIKWLIPAISEAVSASSGDAVSIGELASVEDRDLDAAVTTLTGSPDFLNQFKEKETGCSRPLAWVSIVLEPGQPAGAVRLRSGDYFSPLFRLSATPVRVAIPYPGPYERGSGTLTVVGATGHEAVALLPVWHVSAQGDATRTVNWQPSKRCALPNG